MNSEGAQVSTYQACRVYGNSNGFIGTHAGTRHGFSATLIGEAAEGMQRDYWYTQARNPAALESAEAVGREAARRTLARLSPRKPPTGRFPVLFVPTAAAGLVSGSLRHPAHGLKAALVEQGLAAANPMGVQGTNQAWDPLALVAAVGDPMQALAAALVVEAAQAQLPVLLAGGSQMAAVLALALALLAAGRIIADPPDETEAKGDV